MLEEAPWGQECWEVLIPHHLCKYGDEVISRGSSGGVDSSERPFEVIFLKEPLESYVQGAFPGSCLLLPIRNPLSTQVYRRAQVDLLDAAISGPGFYRGAKGLVTETYVGDLTGHIVYHSIQRQIAFPD